MTVIGSVILVGLFSAKDRDYQARLDTLEAQVIAQGGRVLKRFVQRRGVSDGGVRLMGAPLSRRFLISSGKLDEVAMACESEGADTVIFINDLSDYQRRWLSTRLGCPVFTEADLAGPLPKPPTRRGGRARR